MKRTLLSILVVGILLLSACGAPATTPGTETSSAPETEQPTLTTYSLSISISPSGAGSVSPSDGQHKEGTRVTLTAIPASDYTFDYWNGDASGTSPTITVTMNSDKRVIAHFVEIATILTISPATTQPSPAHAGMNITVSGLGFKASSTITITDLTTGLLIATATSNADGAFQATFEAAGAAGEHVITGSDGTSTLQVSFIMESQPPSAPVLLLPEDATKAEAQAFLDWGTVTDASLPVNYTLQVATNANFTSIVLEKKGLTTSEYTLTTEEKLESVSREAPYYWRVSAVDGAENMSHWSIATSFYVD